MQRNLAECPVALGDDSRGEWRVLAVVTALVAALCQLPTWVNRSFYFWDDSAAQFLPMWHRLGERMLAGDWALMLDTGSWMGGNLAAESLFGIWNPVHRLDYLVVVWLGDLAVAATVVKTQFLVTLGVGVFLLCREYGARRHACSVLGVALPVSGFVRYFHAATWAGGLMGFAWLPLAWWSVRRAMRGRSSALPASTFCFLCVSSGDPYGLLGLCFVFLGLLGETVISGRGDLSRSEVVRALRRGLLLGVATMLTLPLIYLPLVATSPVSWRAGFEMFTDGRLVPGIGDLLNLSMPGFVPRIGSFGSARMTVPATYFAWFVVPLLAWLDWRYLAASWRRCFAPLLLAGCFFLLCLGPSNVWLFRWPLRHIAVLHLALAVPFAVLLSRGLGTDRFWGRLGCTAGALMTCAYLSFAAWPQTSLRHLAWLVTTCALLTLLYRVVSRQGPVVSSTFAALLHLGTAGALALQVFWFPANNDVAAYRFPSDVPQLRRDFAPERDGTVVQIADRPSISEDSALPTVWRHVLFGNMYAAAGVSSLTAYTGIGYEALHRKLCLTYYGSMCVRAYQNLWASDEVGVPLADQIKADHIVVQRKLIEAPQPPPGWRISRRNRFVTVLDRITASPWRRATLSVAEGLSVASNVQYGQRQETVRFARQPGKRSVQLVFARLAWPGYEATVDGVAVPVGATSTGLVRVAIPAGMDAGSLRITWRPPGFVLSVALALLGLAVACGFSLSHWLVRRW
jgi:hypothetical protein